MHYDTDIPVIMSLSHHDPSGSSGIQADIETAASLGCHCTPVITAICAKATGDAVDIAPIDSALLIEQARAILEDMPVKAIKLGFLGSIENIEAAHTILRDYPHIPVILEPLSSLFIEEDSFTAPAMLRAIQSLLLPMADVVSADIRTTHELAQQGDTLDACAQEILESGCQNLLISGGKCTASNFENYFYSTQQPVKKFQWQRLSHNSHGCGATLSASISCYIGHGLRVMDAIEQGQNFSWQSLANCRQLGMGKRIPNRLFWTLKNSNKSQSSQ